VTIGRSIGIPISLLYFIPKDAYEKNMSKSTPIEMDSEDDNYISVGLTTVLDTFHRLRFITSQRFRLRVRDKELTFLMD
jgi:hypothetical protein